MGLTSALNTSVNGLSLNETAIAVIGNNIANADTNGFKSSDTLFTTQLSQTLSVGSGPTATNGGYSGGTRQAHFEAQFDIASTKPCQQIGMALHVRELARSFFAPAGMAFAMPAGNS